MLCAGSSQADSSPGDRQGRRIVSINSGCRIFVVTLLGTYAGISCLTQGKRRLCGFSVLFSFLALSAFADLSLISLYFWCFHCVFFLRVKLSHPAGRPSGHFFWFLASFSCYFFVFFWCFLGYLWPIFTFFAFLVVFRPFSLF